MNPYSFSPSGINRIATVDTTSWSLQKRRERLGESHDLVTRAQASRESSPMSSSRTMSWSSAGILGTMYGDRSSHIVDFGPGVSNRYVCICCHASTINFNSRTVSWKPQMATYNVRGRTFNFRVMSVDKPSLVCPYYVAKSWQVQVAHREEERAGRASALNEPRLLRHALYQ